MGQTTAVAQKIHKKDSRPYSLSSDRTAQRQPPYQVILHDDDDHTYGYVVGLLGKLFGYDVPQAYALAVEVDSTGHAVVDVTTLERAELKRDQIHAYGQDWRLARSAGSMSSSIEPVPHS